MANLSAHDERILSMFEAAHDEMNTRIRMRDTLLAIYSTAVAATIAFSKLESGTAHPEALYIIPYLSFAFTLLVCYHQLGFVNLGAYCTKELWPRLQEKTSAPIFGASNTFLLHRKAGSRFRAIGQLVVLVSPSCLALFLNSHESWTTPPRVLYWWAGLLATLISVGLLYSAYRHQDDAQRG